MKTDAELKSEELAIAQDSRELRWLTLRVLKNAAKVIANSRNTASLIIADQDVPTSLVCVMHPGVDASWFVPAKRYVEIRRKLGWEDRPVRSGSPWNSSSRSWISTNTCSLLLELQTNRC